MQTTIDIPDSLYPQLAAASSAEGLSVEAFVVEAAKQHLEGRAVIHVNPKQPKLRDTPLSALRAHLDGLSDEERRELHEAVGEVQSIIDEEFSQIEPEMWE